MKIIITGSLGHISKPLAIGLVKQGHSVTVISSNADKQKDIEAISAIAAIDRRYRFLSKNLYRCRRCLHHAPTI